MQQFDLRKFKDVVHYAVATTDPDELGRVKLHKVLYFTDMIWFIAEGTGLTGAEYRKQPMGPCATPLSEALAELEGEGRIRQRTVDYFGYQKAHYDAVQPAPALSPRERQLVDDVVEFVCRNHMARSIGDLSHTRAWELADMGDVMPYHTALNMLPVEIEDSAVTWARKEAKKLAIPRPPGATVQRRDYRAFREGVRDHKS